MDIPKDWAVKVWNATADPRHGYAPTLVAYQWAAATYGASSTEAYSRATFNAGGTDWSIIGWADDCLVVLDAHSEAEEWIGGSQETGTGTVETRLYPMSELTSVTLDKVSMQRQGDDTTELATHWTVRIAGRDFPVSPGEKQRPAEVEVVDQFIRGLREKWPTSRG